MLADVTVWLLGLRVDPYCHRCVTAEVCGAPNARDGASGDRGQSDAIRRPMVANW